MSYYFGHLWVTLPYKHTLKKQIHKIFEEKILVLFCKGNFFPEVCHMLNIRCCRRLN